MITELILSGLFGVADVLLSLLPSFDLSIDVSAWTGFASYLSMIFYLLPMGHITAIIAVLIAIAGIRFANAVLHSIVEFIPGL